jgi:hypothetical protein
MTTVLILSCILWVKGDYTTLLDIPISEYGIATMKQEKSGFIFEADVLEERMNSMAISHQKLGVSNFVASYDIPQRSFYTKLNVGSEEASLSCEVKK